MEGDKKESADEVLYQCSQIHDIPVTVYCDECVTRALAIATQESAEAMRERAAKVIEDRIFHCNCGADEPHDYLAIIVRALPLPDAGKEKF